MIGVSQRAGKWLRAIGWGWFGAYDKITLPNRGNSYLVNNLRWYLVLRSHVKFERDKDGKWQLTIEHKPVADGLLNKLIKKTEAPLAQQF